MKMVAFTVWIKESYTLYYLMVLERLNAGGYEIRSIKPFKYGFLNLKTGIEVVINGNDRDGARKLLRDGGLNLK
jgi:hypothetical protein